MSRRYASRRYAGGLGPSRTRTRIPTTRQLGQWVSLRKTLRFRVRLQLSQSRCLSLLLAMSGRVFLFLPPRGHEPPPTLRDRLNPNLSLYRHRFPIPRHAKRPDVALYTVGPFFLLPTPSSTHCALKVSEHDSLWQPPAAHSEERSRPQKSSRAQRCLNALAPGNLKGTCVMFPLGRSLFGETHWPVATKCGLNGLDAFRFFKHTDRTKTTTKHG